MDLQPGIVPLRPLSLSDIYTGVMRLIRGNPGATIGLALLVALVITLPLTALGAALTALVAPDQVPSDPSSSVGSVADLTSNVPALGQILIGLLLPLFMAWVTREAVLGRKVTMGQTWEATRSRVLPGLGALVLTSLIFLGVAVVGGGGIAAGVALGVMVGGGAGVALGLLVGGFSFLVGIILYCFLWTRLAFVFPVLALEGTGPVASITRSWQLTAGRRFWPIFGIRLLTSILVGFITGVLSCPLGFIGGIAQVAFAQDGTIAYLVLGIVNGLSIIITAALSTPLVAGVDALLYLGQRMEQEGHDIELMREVQAGSAPPATGHAS